jgi:uncharacterized protein YacL
MPVHLFARLLLAIILSVVGWQIGESLIAAKAALLGGRYYPALTGLAGAAVGYLGAPLLVGLPYRGLRSWLRKMPARELLMGAIGAIVGLILAALLAAPLSMLPGLWGRFAPISVALALGTLGSTIMASRGKDILALLGIPMGPETPQRFDQAMLLDTSVIIDGRIADIAQTGFIRGALLVPGFILDELQHIADSQDALRRNRGRRGLEILNRMQKDEGLAMQVTEHQMPEIREVDGKLTRLAQELDCPILTNDYNLNRVAELQGIEVLNINELANAVKSVVLPGESLRVRIIQEGKELGQGVGYLDDGTMVVIEDGRRYINMTVNATVTRVLQTVAGRMIFGHLPNGKHT